MKSSRFVTVTVLALAPVLLAQGQTVESRPTITGISHLSVYSSDSAKTESFYVHDLGGIKRDDPENPKGVRFYFSPIQFIEVLPLPTGEASINRLDHVAYNTTNAEELRRYLAAHQITVPSGVQSASDGSRWFEVDDPEGNKVQFVQPPAKPAPVPPNLLSNHIIHVGYMVHNQSAEDAFYRAVLGFRPYWHGGGTEEETKWISQQVPDGTDWIEYMMVSGPETKGIPAGLSASSLGGMDHFSLGVHNMEKTAELLYAGNRLPERASGPKIGRDGKWQYNLFDPDGTRAEIMEFQPVVKPCCSEFTAASPTK
jgi:catechol 2,3-dioxygenase-like lactoylglutathione lyase family enzyme